jgi:hypothetical protein
MSNTELNRIRPRIRDTIERWCIAHGRRITASGINQDNWWWDVETEPPGYGTRKICVSVAVGFIRMKGLDATLESVNNYLEQERGKEPEGVQGPSGPQCDPGPQQYDPGPQCGTGEDVQTIQGYWIPAAGTSPICAVMSHNLVKYTYRYEVNGEVREVGCQTYEELRDLISNWPKSLAEQIIKFHTDVVGATADQCADSARTAYRDITPQDLFGEEGG